MMNVNIFGLESHQNEATVKTRTLAQFLLRYHWFAEVALAYTTTVVH